MNKLPTQFDNSLTKDYVSPYKIMEKLKHLEPFNKHEKELIANELAKEQYLFLENRGFTVYKREDVDLWFIKNHTIKELIQYLEEQKQTDKIYLSLNVDEYDDESMCSEDIRYNLCFGVKGKKTYINEQVVKKLTMRIEEYRKNLKDRSEKEIKLKDKQEKLKLLLEEYASGKLSLEKFDEKSREIQNS